MGSQSWLEKIVVSHVRSGQDGAPDTYVVQGLPVFRDELTWSGIKGVLLSIQQCLQATGLSVLSTDLETGGGQVHLRLAIRAVDNADDRMRVESQAQGAIRAWMYANASMRFVGID